MSEQNWSRETSRRTILKTTAASIAGLSGVSSLAPLGRGAEGSDPQPISDPEPAPAPDIYIGSDLKKFNWFVLLGNERDSMADALTGYVEEATVDREQQRAASESLNDIWSTIEVTSETKSWESIRKQREKRRRKRTDDRWQTHGGDRRRKQERKNRAEHEKEGKTTLYSLESPESVVKETLKGAESKVQKSKGVRTTSVSKEDAATLSELSDVIGSGMKDDDTGEIEEVEPMWHPDSTHEKITEIAVNSGAKPGSLDNVTTSDIGEWSRIPDDEERMDYDPAPEIFPDDIFPEEKAQAYAHAWNPDPVGLQAVTGPVGGGPKYTQKFMKNAEDNSGEDRFKQLAFAMHIIEDLANPLHTGAWVTGTAWHRSIHRTYEKKVDSRFDELFKEDLEDIENLEVVTDPWYVLSKYDYHARKLGSDTHPYASEVAVAVHENSHPLDHVGDKTKQCMEWAEMYAAGLAAELTGYT